MSKSDKRPTSTSEQLRADIDAGRTGDKTKVFDPATAPLGTDEEAAGTPLDVRQMDRMRRQENGSASSQESPRKRGIRHYQIGGTAGVVALAILLAIVIASPWGGDEPPGQPTSEEVVPG